jgi:hypothetical protein
MLKYKIASEFWSLREVYAISFVCEHDTQLPRADQNLV